MSVDTSKLSDGHILARDIFMVGVWTAQRVSDYNNLSRENIKDHRIPKIIDDKLTFKEFQTVEIRQKKTGTKVSVPVSSELKSILEHYDYQLPHLEDQVINRYMKDICRFAGLDELIEIPCRRRRPSSHDDGGVLGLFSSGGPSVRSLTRYDGEVSEPLVGRQGSRVSMRVARASASLLSSHGRVPGTSPG